MLSVDMEAKEVPPVRSDGGEASRTVRDVMRGRPKTLPDTASMADLRGFFADPHVVTALVIRENGALVGVVERAAVAGSALSDEAPIDAVVQRDVDAIDVRAPAADVWKHRDLTRTGRLVVLEPDGKTLAGLVCAMPDGEGFCR